MRKENIKYGKGKMRKSVVFKLEISVKSEFIVSIFYLCPLSLSSQLFQNTFLSKRNQDALEKYLMIGLAEGKYKVSLRYLFVPESKDLIKDRW